MAAKSGVLGAVFAPSSLTSITFTNEATTGNVERTEYTINDTAKRYWDPAASYTVQQSTDGGTTWFQSSPGTKTGCYYEVGVSQDQAQGFNPHPVLRPGAMQ